MLFIVQNPYHCVLYLTTLLFWSLYTFTDYKVRRGRIKPKSCRKEKKKQSSLFALEKGGGRGGLLFSSMLQPERKRERELGWERDIHLLVHSGGQM